MGVHGRFGRFERFGRCNRLVSLRHQITQMRSKRSVAGVRFFLPSRHFPRLLGPAITAIAGRHLSKNLWFSRDLAGGTHKEINGDRDGDFQ